MRKLVLACSFLLAASACAGDSGSTTSTPGESDTTTTVAGTTSTPGSEDTTTTVGDTPTTSDRELAPDFTLELGEGGSYTLSDGARPVYLVFWAEW
ncbi:MAG: hypothetical protein WDZ96_06845 [Acidimicrobiia bacterium]